MTGLTGSSPDLNALAGRQGTAAPEFLPTAFRRSRQQVAAPSDALDALDALFKDGAGLMYSQAVAAYLQPFCAKPQDMPAVLADVKDIWLQEGFLPVDDLTSHLIKRRHPDLPEAATDLLHQQIKARYREVEPLTRYERKEHAPLTIGLGHLYGVLTRRPATLILADDSNLGGLTQHIDKLMAARDSRAPGQTEEGSPAFELADRVLRAMAGVARDALQEGILQSRRMASHVAYRSGGDEKQYLVTGLSEAALQPIINNRMTPTVEQLCAELGLYKHEHLKHRDDRTHAGTSTAFSFFPLNARTIPGVALTTADETLATRKLEAGIKRCGRAPAGHFNALSPAPEVLSRLRDDLIAEHAQPLAGSDSSLLQLEMANHLMRTAAAQRRKFDMLAKARGTDHEREAQALDYDLATYDAATGKYGSTNQRHLAPYNMEPETAGRLLRNIERVLENPPYAKYQRPLPKAAEIERGSERPNLLFATPIELEALRFDYRAQKAGLTLTPEQSAVCHSILGSFSPIDPPTSALMKDVMPGLFGRFARDSERLRNYMSTDPTLCTRLNAKPGDVQSWAVAATMGNLAGINKLLGSDNANIVLRHFKENVVEGAFKAKGITPHNLEIGHEGGGNMMVLIRPIIETAQGPALMTEKLATGVTSTMATRMDKWRTTNVAAFLKKHGGTVPDGLSGKLTFADIVDPKRSQKGVSLFTHAMPLTTLDEQGSVLTGGHLRARLAALRDAKIEASRNGAKTDRALSANLQP